MSGLGKLFTTALIAFCSLALLVGSLTCFTSVWAQGNDTTPQASATAADPPERAVTPLPNTAAMSATDESAGDGVSALGTLGFADGVLSSGGDFYLQLTGLPPTPANGQYVLWLLSPITDAYPLATFSTSDGARDLTGTTSLNLPLLFTTAQITLEPRTDSSITATVPPTMSARTVLSATPSAEVIERLRPLLALYGETTGDAEGDEEDEEEYGPAPEDVGALAAAQRQVGIAVQHTGFLRNALSEDDIPQARRHAEHIINILDGKNGFMYGDLDRNGLPENPGDGVGVRVYLAAAKAALPDVADLFTATHQIDDSAVAVAATVDTGQALITDMFDKALQIFAADTVTEANRFAGELTLLVDNLDQVVDDAHSRTLGLVTFSFPGPPRAVTLPAPPPTATPTPETGDEAITATVTGPLAPITAALTTRTTPTATVRLRPTATPGARRSATPTAVPTPTATASSTPIPPLPTVESSALTDPAAGARWQNPTDGVVYVYVPGGTFAMGADAANAISPKEEPQHAVTVDGFWLQQTETTNRQYARCVAAGLCTPPTNSRWDDLAFADHPVSDVSWEQATAYAAWAGGRLPTEAEWERTCRGDDGRTYPWGNEEPTADRANFNSAVGDTVPVGSYPAGRSAFGALDLSGNLWEWTSSVEADYPYVADDGRESDDLTAGNRTVRGGSFYYTNYQIRCAARTGFAPDTANEHIGFRIVLTVGE